MAVFDAHANLALATVAVAPSPALSGTSLIITTGFASLFPAVPFNCTVYPATASPTNANAEIVRVTNITGDIFTIVRAQEGTTAKAIAAGYRIGNTVTAKVFTDIETAINSITAGNGILSISAGTSNATGGQVVFSNSNGVSFGANGSVITASFSGAGGGGAAISAGANSQNTGTVVLSNSNGVTFGLSNNGVLTASHNGLTSQSAQAASATNGSFTFQTLGFSNANGVTFGTSAGSIITASVGTAAGGNSVNFSAGTTSNNLGSIIFSNSNGVSFGLDGSTVTAQHNALTSQSNQAASATNGSFTFQTLGFSNANNVTFGTSAGSIITASVAPPGAGSVNFSAGTTSNNLASVVFSNSNGVTFGLNGATITASAAGGGGGVTLKSFTSPDMAVGTMLALNASTNSYAGAFVLPQAIQFDYVRLPAQMANSQVTIATLASASATAEGAIFQTYNAVIYSMGTGASSQSLQSVASGSGGLTFLNSISITNSTQGSYTVGVTAPLRGGSTVNTTQYSISNTNYSFTTGGAGAAFAGTRMLDIPLATVLPPGNYWMMFGMSSGSSSAGPAGLAAITNARVSVTAAFFASQVNSTFDEMGQAAVFGAFLAGGIYGTAGGTTASLNFTDIIRNGAYLTPYFQLAASS